jgi:hypothetical protein
MGPVPSAAWREGAGVSGPRARGSATRRRRLGRAPRQRASPRVARTLRAGTKGQHTLTENVTSWSRPSNCGRTFRQRPAGAAVLQGRPRPAGRRGRGGRGPFAPFGAPVPPSFGAAALACSRAAKGGKAAAPGSPRPGRGAEASRRHRHPATASRSQLLLVPVPVRKDRANSQSCRPGTMADFVHVHLHTLYSLLDGAAS